MLLPFFYTYMEVYFELRVLLQDPTMLGWALLPGTSS